MIIRIAYNNSYRYRIGKFFLVHKKIQLSFSSVSARKLMCPGSAQLGSARLGTFIARACSSRKIPARTHL